VTSNKQQINWEKSKKINRKTWKWANQKINQKTWGLLIVRIIAPPSLSRDRRIKGNKQ